MRFRGTVFSLALLAAAAFTPALAHEGHEHGVIASALANPSAALTDPSSVVANPNIVPAAPAPRTLVDQPDTTPGRKTHAIYFVPANVADRELDRNGVIARSVDAMTAWFAAAGVRPRIDRLSDGTVDVTFVRGARTWQDYRAVGRDSFLQAIHVELEARGFNDATKRYLIYAQIPSARTCGEGYLPGRYAAVYLDADVGCGSDDFATGPTAGAAGRVEAVAAQEWLHNEGIVPSTAPHHCWTGIGHVCTAGLSMLGMDPEAPDVVYPYVTAPLRSKVLDRGNDDYYKHPWPHADLADSRWVE